MLTFDFVAELLVFRGRVDVRIGSCVWLAGRSLVVDRKSVHPCMSLALHFGRLRDIVVTVEIGRFRDEVRLPRH